jgi:hypothetical protein
VSEEVKPAAAPSAPASQRRSPEEIAAWEKPEPHSLAATLLFRLGLQPAEEISAAEKERKPTLELKAPYTAERIMDTIAQVTAQIANYQVTTAQGNAILYALQTLLTASRVVAQEKMAEARSQPRQHLHIHEHRHTTAKENTKCPPKKLTPASADTQQNSTTASITAPTSDTANAAGRRATARATTPQKPPRKRIGTRTAGQKNRPRRRP